MEIFEAISMLPDVRLSLCIQLDAVGESAKTGQWVKLEPGHKLLEPRRHWASLGPNGTVSYLESNNGSRWMEQATADNPKN
jgi:hypothetical protein